MLCCIATKIFKPDCRQVGSSNDDKGNFFEEVTFHFDNKIQTDTEYH